MGEPINIPEARLIWAANRQAFNDGRPSSVHQSLALLTCALDEIESLRGLVAELNAQLDAANATLSAECVEHSELNGHIDIAEQCRDYLNHQTMDEGDPTGKLQDFVGALRIVIDQCDRQGRRANWHEAGYTAGKTKVIEYAVAKEAEAIAAWLESGAIEPARPFEHKYTAAARQIRAGEHRSTKNETP